MSLHMPDFESFFEQTNIDEDTIEVIKLLTNSCIETVNLTQQKNNVFLTSTEIARCDVILFAFFWSYTLCLVVDEPLATKFKNEYKSHIASSVEILEISTHLFETMYNNRIPFYENILSKTSGIKSGINSILEEFEYILLTDYINDGYCAFDENSPLPLVDIDKTIQCHVEIAEYFTLLETKTEGIIICIQGLLSTSSHKKPSHNKVCNDNICPNTTDNKPETKTPSVLGKLGVRNFLSCLKINWQIIPKTLLAYILLLSIQHMVSSYFYEIKFIGGYRLPDEVIKNYSCYIGFIVAFACIFVLIKVIARNVKMQNYIIFTLGVYAILHGVLLFINCITTFSTFEQNKIFLPFVGVGLIFHSIQCLKVCQI